MAKAGDSNSDYTAFPDRWDGEKPLLELERDGRFLRVTITAQGMSASRSFEPGETEELAGALARIYRNVRLSE